MLARHRTKEWDRISRYKDKWLISRKRICRERTGMLLMIMIAGTIRQNVQMAAMNNLIEQKKEKGFVKNQAQLSPEERMIEQFKEQAAQEKEAEYTNGIANKVMTGKKLSSEEIEYLQKKNPELLKKYRDMQEEMKAYERQLRRCKTKEEVERVRVNKINGYLAQAKSVSNNPVIPKGEKKAILEEIVARLTNIEKAHMKFVKSVEYKDLPREQEIAKERAEKTGERQEAATEMLKEAGEKQKELVEELTEETGNVDEKQLPDPDVKLEKPEAEEDIAKKAMTLIQAALTRLNENSYNNTGGTVSVDLDRDTGKRIDIKR